MADIFRLLVQAITLTGSDLSSSSKPWPEQEKTSEIIYREFYEQVKDAIQNVSLSIFSDISVLFHKFHRHYDNYFSIFVQNHNPAPNLDY